MGQTPRESLNNSSTAQCGADEDVVRMYAAVFLSTLCITCDQSVFTLINPGLQKEFGNSTCRRAECHPVKGKRVRTHAHRLTVVQFTLNSCGPEGHLQEKCCKKGSHNPTEVLHLLSVVETAFLK